MKPFTIALITTILMSAAATSASFAAQESASRGVTVMSRGEVDPTMLKTDMYAYAAYKTDGIEGAVWGSIKRIHPDGIVIESETEPSETRKISFGDVGILAVTEDRLALESWLDLRLAAEKITVMTREDLDLTKLATGSYAHVVYTWRGFKRMASGKVLEADPNGIVIESGAEPPGNVENSGCGNRHTRFLQDHTGGEKVAAVGRKRHCPDVAFGFESFDAQGRSKRSRCLHFPWQKTKSGRKNRSHVRR